MADIEYETTGDDNEIETDPNIIAYHSFIETNPKWVEERRGKWAAVVNERIVMVEPNFNDLLDKLRDIHSDKPAFLVNIGIDDVIPLDGDLVPED